MKIDYLQKQNLLQNEANKILDSLDLLSFLKKLENLPLLEVTR